MATIKPYVRKHRRNRRRGLTRNDKLSFTPVKEKPHNFKSQLLKVAAALHLR